MRNRIFCLLLFTALLFIPMASPGKSHADDGREPEAAGKNITLTHAVMCEDLKDLVPQNPTTIFSIERRQAICFTSFDPVPETTVIYHQWFHRDQPSAKIKLTVKPPRWSTYSSIQFRPEDIGPWRVEITDAQGNIFQVLRFSITD